MTTAYYGKVRKQKYVTWRNEGGSVEHTEPTRIRFPLGNGRSTYLDYEAMERTEELSRQISWGYRIYSRRDNFGITPVTEWKLASSKKEANQKVRDWAEKNGVKVLVL